MKEARESGPFSLNTVRGSSLCCRNPYPALLIRQACLQRGKFSISFQQPFNLRSRGFALNRPAETVLP